MWDNNNNLISSFDIIDEDLKMRLGSDNVTIKVKSFDWLKENDTFLFGCENNLVLKVCIN